jgi:hypothetical protein
MFSSIKHRKSLSRLLAWSLVVVGLTQSVIRPSAASHDTTPTQLTPIVKESKESAAPGAGAVDEATKARVSAAYNKLPLRFEENRGQVDTQVKYLSRGSASTLFLTKTEAVLTLHRDESKEKQASPMSVVRMRLHGANRSPGIAGEHEMRARTNYFIGNDPQRWHGDVAQYERVRYEQIYPGIDLLYYGQQQSLEYDFEVAPGADPRRIVLGFKGVRGLKIDSATGDLVLKTASGEVRQHKPVVYQEVDGERREVKGRYVLKGKRKVGFQLGAYDKRKRLVIDPVLTYSTYLGSGTESGNGIAVDAAGNAYVIGSTNSNSFPVLNQYQTAQGSSDVFVTRINTNLSGAASLIYSTYLGGNSTDLGYGIAADAAGNAYVAGYTRSTDFPILNQYQTYQGGFAAGDAFMTKLNTNLSGTASLLYSTCLGGNTADDVGQDIAVDSSGNAYVTGYTHSTNFPILHPYQTFQGGDDAFVVKLNPNLSGTASLLYSTYLGGTSTDYGNGIALDSSGNVYVTGYTFSANFPILHPYQTYQAGRAAFVSKLTVLAVTHTPGDFDLDGKTDLAVWHPSNGDWQYLRSTDGVLITQHWGASGDRPVPRYYDQDDKTDLAVYRPSVGNWYIFQSVNSTVRTVRWGASTDLPVAADYDGDGKADVALYRPSEGVWHIIQSSNNNALAIRWGISEDKPVPADYDGDGKADLAVYRPSESNWYILQSSNNLSRALQWGVSGDKPVIGDYDGDQRADVAVFRPSTGTWYALRSSDGSLFAVQWGVPGDMPVPGDYDADSKTDTAVWRPSTGTWYIVKSSDGLIVEQQFGSSGDIPVPATYLPE